MKYYFDTSILIPLYCYEALSAKAPSLLETHTQQIISWLSEVEFFSSLSIKLRTKQIPIQEAQAASRLFRKHVDEGIYHRLPLSEETYLTAQRFLSEFSSTLRTLDALHLACCKQHHLSLMTADKGLAQAAKHFGIAYHAIQ